MEQEDDIGDLDLSVEKLDGEDGESEEGASDCDSGSEIELDGEGDTGLAIYKCPPTQDKKHQFQWHFPREFKPVGCVHYGHTESGKWMLFYPLSEIDEKWEMAKDLFDSGELTCVRGLKVSTAVDNPRSSDNTTAVLIMYCGPWTDEQLMRKIGRNLALKTKYESETGCMMYKTDDQTRGGTRATGQTVNHVYQMQVPRPTERTTSSDMPELPPSKDRWQWHFPKCSPSGCAEEYDYSKSGRWMLFYSIAEIDEKWQMMKGLFDSNELDGVRGLKVSTATSLHGNRRGNRSAVIMAYCGPWDDEELVLRVGANLAQKMLYEDKSGTLRYKTYIVGKGTTSLGHPIPKYNQVLPVPRPSVGASYSQSGMAELHPPSKDMRSYRQWHPQSQDGIMRYKVDAPREGRRATDQSSPSYWVQVPKPQAMGASGSDTEYPPSRYTAEYAPSRDTAEFPPSRATGECPPSRDTGECPPSREKHRKPLDGFEYDPSTSGKWMLFYPMSEIDDRWHQVKSLLDAGELHGVGELKVSTAKGSAGHDSGVINVFCGPYDDGELVTRIGKNLAKKMQYKNREGVMLYKAEGQRMGQGRGMGRGWNHLYEISLPWRYV